MRNYELTVVLSGKAMSAKTKSTQEKIKKLVTGTKGKVTKMEDWGEKELAYQIAKKSTGNFLHFQLELEPGTAREIDSKLNLEEDIIRYLLVKKE